MSGFRGDDDSLDREIRTLEDVGRIRLRRFNRELRDIDRDLRELRRERARRKAAAATPAAVPQPVEATP